jgi:hypothetical protein
LDFSGERELFAQNAYVTLWSIVPIEALTSQIFVGAFCGDVNTGNYIDVQIAI